MARRRVKKRLQLKRQHKQHRIANPYKKQHEGSIDVKTSELSSHGDEEMMVEDGGHDNNHETGEEVFSGPQPSVAETQPKSRRGLLLRQAADRKKLQVLVKTLRSRRKKLKRSNKEQKKRISRRIKELMSNLHKKHANELKDCTGTVEEADVSSWNAAGAGQMEPQNTSGPQQGNVGDAEQTATAINEGYTYVVPRKKSKRRKAKESAQNFTQLASQQSEVARPDMDVEEADDEEMEGESDDGLEKVEDIEL